MLFDDTYKTIARPAEGVFNDRGSKFIAYAYPITSDADIKQTIAQLKQQHPKANHYCWAIRLGTDRSVFKINDDSEPSGTAGRPILNTLLSNNLTNILVVVVRYFGGTLLGVPGLINAYRSGTEVCLQNASIIERTVNDVYTATFGYQQLNDVMRILKELRAEILKQHLEGECLIQFSTRKTLVEQTVSRLNKVNSIKLVYDHSS